MVVMVYPVLDKIIGHGSLFVENIGLESSNNMVSPSRSSSSFSGDSVLVSRSGYGESLSVVSDV